MLRAALALLGISLAITGAGCDSSQTYSLKEATDAFNGQGFDIRLRMVSMPDGEGGVFGPGTGEPFFVIVTTDDSDVSIFRAAYEGLRDADTFEASRGNVAVIADGLKRKDRKRVLAALSALPSRG